MDTKELIRFCKQEIGEMKEHGHKEFFEKVYYEEIIKTLKEHDELIKRYGNYEEIKRLACIGNMNDPLDE